MWNFPHCLGALDGKHIIIQAPERSGSDYHNYKGHFSIVLFAVVDGTFNFMYVNVGCQGRISDGGVFSHTQFKEALDNGTLDLPHPTALPGRDKPVPYTFVGDDAFGLSVNLMKPYQGQHEKGSAKRIFNYRLSRARRIVENVFGIMSSVFRVLQKPMLVNPDTAKQVTLACVHLHNYLRHSETSRKKYTPVGTFDGEDRDNDTRIPGSWRNQLSHNPSIVPIPCNASTDTGPVEAENIRTEFAEYFISNVGSVPWQDQHS